MLLKKGQIAGVWDAMTLMWRPRCISMLNMVQNCICVYMHIVYCHFCGAFVIFSVIILCFSVDTIFSAFWLKLRVLFVQLKMLWSQTQDNGHAGWIHLARLKCSQLCWCSSRWIFSSCSSQTEHERSNTLAILKLYNSSMFVQIQSWTDQQVSRKKNKRCAIIQNELPLMSFYFVACKF